MISKNYEIAQKAANSIKGACIVSSRFVGPLGSRELFTVEVNGKQKEIPYIAKPSIKAFKLAISIIAE